MWWPMPIAAGSRHTNPIVDAQIRRTPEWRDKATIKALVRAVAKPRRRFSRR